MGNGGDLAGKQAVDWRGLPIRPVALGGRSLFQQLPRDDHPLDLVGALVDLGDRRAAASFRR
jgi:hypothetical protein